MSRERITYMRTIIMLAVGLLALGGLHTTARSNALVSDDLMIISPSDGSVANSGDTLDLLVETVRDVLGVRIFLKGVGPTEWLENPPFQFSVEIPKGVAGLLEIQAHGVTSDGRHFFSPPIAVNVRSDKRVVEIQPSFRVLDLNFIGDQFGLLIQGRAEDGNVFDVTNWIDTRWATSDASIVTISENGEAVARGGGAASITIRYEELESSVKVNVRDAEVGDLVPPEGIDQSDVSRLVQEIQVGAVSRVEERDGRDLNGDGMVDIRDVNELLALCDTCLPQESVKEVRVAVSVRSPDSLSTSRGTVKVSLLDEGVGADDLGGVWFGPGQTEPVNRDRLSFRDVNGNGMRDVSFLFDVADTGLTSDDTEACLTVQLVDRTLQGCAPITYR